MPTSPGGQAAECVRPLWSDSCGLDDLLLPYVVDGEVAGRLECGGGWARRWTVRWKTAGAEVVFPVGELAAVPVVGVVPARRFSWRPDQRHRPGLRYMLATGRMHGFESLAERRLLLALDFVGGLREVLSQPLRLRFYSMEGRGEHVPDFLVVSGRAPWLLDVRPAGQIKEKDVLRFAAAERVAAAAGWRYAVATGWHGQVMTTLDALSARRRPMSDRLGLAARLLELCEAGPVRLRELVEATEMPALARPHLVHLLWHRRLAMDLAQPLGDESWIYPVPEAR